MGLLQELEEERQARQSLADYVEALAHRLAMAEQLIGSGLGANTPPAPTSGRTAGGTGQPISCPSPFGYGPGPTMQGPRLIIPSSGPGGIHCYPPPGGFDLQAGSFFSAADRQDETGQDDHLDTLGREVQFRKEDLTNAAQAKIREEVESPSVWVLKSKWVPDDPTQPAPKRRGRPPGAKGKKAASAKAKTPGLKALERFVAPAVKAAGRIKAEGRPGWPVRRRR